MAKLGMDLPSFYSLLNPNYSIIHEFISVWKSGHRTGLGPLRTGNHTTAQDRNRSPVRGPSPFRKFQDRTKTGLDQSGPVFVVGIFY